MPYTRPTTDIAKEGLFNMLQHLIDFNGTATLDLFGGTGAITYELCSRGAAESIIVEKDPQMHAFIKENIEQLKLPATAVRSDVFRFIETCNRKFDFIFAGPPYVLTSIDDLPLLVMQRKLLKPQGWFVLEHTPRNQYDSFEGFVKQRNYGTTIFSFFRSQ